MGWINLKQMINKNNHGAIISKLMTACSNKKKKDATSQKEKIKPLVTEKRKLDETSDEEQPTPSLTSVTPRSSMNKEKESESNTAEQSSEADSHSSKDHLIVSSDVIQIRSKKSETGSSKSASVSKSENQHTTSQSSSKLKPEKQSSSSNSSSISKNENQHVPSKSASKSSKSKSERRRTSSKSASKAKAENHHISSKSASRTSKSKSKSTKTSKSTPTSDPEKSAPKHVNKSDSDQSASNTTTKSKSKMSSKEDFISTDKEKSHATNSDANASQLSLSSLSSKERYDADKETDDVKGSEVFCEPRRDELSIKKKKGKAPENAAVKSSLTTLTMHDFLDSCIPSDETSSMEKKSIDKLDKILEEIGNEPNDITSWKVSESRDKERPSLQEAGHKGKKMKNKKCPENCDCQCHKGQILRVGDRRRSLDSKCPCFCHYATPDDDKSKRRPPPYPKDASKTKDQHKASMSKDWISEEKKKPRHIHTDVLVEVSHGKYTDDITSPDASSEIGDTEDSKSSIEAPKKAKKQSSRGIQKATIKESKIEYKKVKDKSQGTPLKPTKIATEAASPSSTRSQHPERQYFSIFPACDKTKSVFCGEMPFKKPVYCVLPFMDLLHNTTEFETIGLPWPTVDDTHTDLSAKVFTLNMLSDCPPPIRKNDVRDRKHGRKSFDLQDHNSLLSTLERFCNKLIKNDQEMKKLNRKFDYLVASGVIPTHMA